MKRFLIIIGCWLLVFSGIAKAQDGGFAKAEEFGSPRLDLNTPQYLKYGDMRTWQLPSGPLQAMAVAVLGEWGRNAVVQLRTADGLQLGVPARNMQESDLNAVRQWLADNEFTELETLRHGNVLCKILAVTELSDYTLFVHLVQPDGVLRHWPIYRKTLQPGQRFDARPVPVTQQTLNLLHKHLQDQKELPSAPLAIAESVQEAAACAAIRGQSVVVLFLNQRGSSTDTNFRNYLKRYPYAAAQLSRRHVFLLAYKGEDGTYSGRMMHDLIALEHQLAPDNNAGIHCHASRQLAEANLDEQHNITHGVHFMPHPYARSNEPNPPNCYIFTTWNDFFPAPEKLYFNMQ